VVFFNVVGDETPENTAFPVAFASLPVGNKCPKILVGLDSLLVLVDLRPLSGRRLQVNLLLVDLDHSFLERN